jgi:RND family efflux transporter MFP subunit
VSRAALALFVCLAGFAVGCGRTPPPVAPRKPPEVLIATPVSRSVADYEEFTGRTEASHAIDVRARVTGYLDRVRFKEGADVKAGDLLFEIDPRTCQAEFDRAKANCELAEARLARLEADYQRAKSLLATRAISPEEYERAVADRAEAAASLDVAKAGLEVARLNLDFTRVLAPVAGRIGRLMIDPGNLVKADDTVLSNIVASNPIYAYFDVDERTTLRLRRLALAGKIRSARDSTLPVELGLTDEEGYSFRGTVDFVDNHLLPNTGTLRLRGVFENAAGLLSPGLFVRTRIPVGEPYEATLVSEQALGTDQGQKFVYVVDGKNVVQARPVRVGALHDGMRVIESGLAPGERVIVSGLQRVRPGTLVEPRAVDMPILGDHPPPGNPINRAGSAAGR